MMMMIRGRAIGRGATATVSIAASSSGEFFAAKSAELSVSALLQREQQILSQLNSPRVVKYVGSSITMESSKLYYNLFTEFVSGGSLSDLIARRGGSVTEPTIRSYTKDIILGLDYLHSNFIVHCDVKSQNILIGDDGAKIADLGCSKKAGIESCDLGFTGTPIFMAPEVARGEEQSFPADVWALGCTVIEMATGLFNPWPELTDPVSALYRIGYTDDSPEFPTSLSDDGRDFLKRCLERDPRERWTAKQLLRHPFVDCLGRTTEFTGNDSPFSVLDQGFWDLPSVVSDQASRNITLLSSSSSSPADRLKNLAGSGHDLKDWDWDENNWVCVRSSEQSHGESAPATETEGFEFSANLDPSRDDDEEEEGVNDYYDEASSIDFNNWGDVSNFENYSPLIIISNCKRKQSRELLLLLLFIHSLVCLLIILLKKIWCEYKKEMTWEI